MSRHRPKFLARLSPDVFETVRYAVKKQDAEERQPGNGKQGHCGDSPQTMNNTPHTETIASISNGFSRFLGSDVMGRVSSLIGSILHQRETYVLGANLN